jgi:hypothetical protein
MAKKKSKGKNHLPKRIAGVKVPKSVRRGRLGALLASPLGQELLAGAVVAGSGVLAAHKAKHDPAARHLAAKVKHGADESARDAAEASSLLAHALGEAARSFAEALQSGGGKQPDWTGAHGEEAASSKKKSSYAPTPGL